MAPTQTALERRVEQIAESLEGDEGLRLRVALVERGLSDHRLQSADQHKAVLSAIAGLRADLSDQGHTPAPVRPRGWTIGLKPGSGREIAVILLAVLAGIGGPVAGVLLQADEPEPVEVLRVLPVPQVVPVPMPADSIAPPPVPEPDPVVRPDDPLMEDR